MDVFLLSIVISTNKTEAAVQDTNEGTLNVQWEDENFGESICNALKKEEVTYADIEGITGISIDSQYVVKLDWKDKTEEYVYNSGNDMCEILALQEFSTLEDLKKFPYLRELCLNECIVDDNTALGELTKLENLKLDGYSIDSLDRLKNLTALKSLIIQGAEFEDLQALKELTNMEELRFCTWCRAELPVISEKKKNDLGRIIAIVILISVICACLAGVFMLFKDKNSGKDQGEAIAQKEENRQVDKDISAEKKSSGVYVAPFMNNEGKWGYINTDGDVVIECKYDSAYEFDQDGYAVVGMQTDSDASEYYTIYGLVNTEGEEIIPLDYSYINSSIGSTCDNYGYRTITRLPYPFDYDEQYSGVMDKNGNIMMSPEYSSIYNIGDSGYFIACESETGMYGIIDENYEWICEAEYSDIYKVWEDSTDNLVKVNGEYLLIAEYDFQEGHGAEIINEYGETIVPMEYYDINSQCGMNRLVVENSEGYYGAIDLEGNLEVPCQYDELGNFSYDNETYAMKDNAVFIVDIYGNERFLTNADECWQMDSNLYEVGINENWNVIDSNGEYLFSETHDNHEVNEKYIAGNNEEKKHGMLILKSGEVVNTEYQKYMLSYTVPDIVGVYDGANYGMLGSNGELIVPCSYDSCEISEDGAYITADRQKDEYGNYTECTLFDSNGNKIETFDTGIYNVGVFRKISNAA